VPLLGWAQMSVEVLQVGQMEQVLAQLAPMPRALLLAI
jgi:hypothetical protein